MKWTKWIRPKSFNYKKFGTLIRKLLQILRQNHPCTCDKSQFEGEYHGHVVTGSLRTVTNNRLRKLIPKRPRSRGINSLN